LFDAPILLPPLRTSCMSRVSSSSSLTCRATPETTAPGETDGGNECQASALQAGVVKQFRHLCICVAQSWLLRELKSNTYHEVRFSSQDHELLFVCSSSIVAIVLLASAARSSTPKGPGISTNAKVRKIARERFRHCTSLKS